MPRLGDVCRHIRSKNAGPFWITVDLFFRDDEAYRSYKDDPNISARCFAKLYGADESLIKLIQVDSLRVVKVSYPRPKPQGWQGERDMHAGQQYVSLLDVELAAA
ncbi:MAG: hypothetical protein QOD93_2856 [Acetobacteraceae bacterium]|jgi:hypothetical protein|nr:hypothetical protein [Acetobacteraceae bacterium]